MEVGQKLVELNITAAEVDMLSKALKNEKFQGMLANYFQEISDPENVRTYEKEMTLLEQSRGNSIEFVHPVPFRALETSVDGEQRCFINICACDKVGKPELKTVRTKAQYGQQWSLPHLLQPGRPDCEPEGKIFTIYDVCFHPETLHLADKSKSFMDMVMQVATQGIQKAFKVTLDKGNLIEMDIPYKGVPQLCVIRKPIPGYEAKEEEQDLSPLRTPIPGNSFEDSPKPLHRQPQEPTKPHYTVKYRSVVDLQDFRASRDSVRSPRPTEIVVTIDLPLLTMVKDTALEVEERRLLLESNNPQYKLELLLSYPVDENKGRAKFNKQTRQLTVTLPVQPAPNHTSDSQKQSQIEDPEECGILMEERAEQTQRGNNTDAVQGKCQETGGQKQEEEGQKVQDENKNKTPECEVTNKMQDEDSEEKRHREKKINCQRGTKESHGVLLQKTEASSDTDKQRTLVFDEVKKENASCGLESDIQTAIEKQGTVEVHNSSQELKSLIQATMVVNVSVPDSKRTPAEKQMEDAKKQTFQKPEETNVPLPGILKEVAAGVTKTIPEDPTSAGFDFQNNLVFDLD